jgi:hypothetical protein
MNRRYNCAHGISFIHRVPLCLAGKALQQTPIAFATCCHVSTREYTYLIMQLSITMLQLHIH